MSGKPLITANMVTTARLVGMPILAWMVYQGETGWWWALILGNFIGSTDFVDGYLARKHGPTVLGGLLDPIADKVLIAAWYLPRADPQVGVLPAWPVAVLFLREFLVTAMRSAFEQRDLVMRTSYLGKLKTWSQMQGIGVMMLMVMLESHRDIMAWILGVGMVLPVLVTIPVYFIQKRVYWSALIMGALQGVVFGLYLVVHYQVMVLIVLIAIVALTWLSGADYLLGGFPKLKQAGDFAKADFVRILGAAALPITVIWCLIEAPTVWFLPIGGVLAIELAVGGLDNLLSHHRAASGAFAWASRTLGASLFLFLAVVATKLGYVSLANPLAMVGLVISLVGGAREFWRGSDYYLDARLRDKALV